MSIERRVKSFEGFVEGLQEQSPELIVVQAERKPPRSLFGIGASNSRAVGILGNWQYGLHYGVQRTRRSRAYFESLLTAFGSERGVGDQDKREKQTIATLLAAETRVDLLRTELPDTRVYIAGPDAEPMSAEDLQRLHEDAETHGVVSLLTRA
jgi:hypothetical protein